MKRPWNIPDLPVYSLATYLNGTVNMNICTYVTAISMKPKLYAVAVFHGSATLSRLQQGAGAVLQLLHQDQYRLVRVLGQKSGHVVNKQNWLDRLQLLRQWHEFNVLKDSCACIELRIESFAATGDHDLYVMAADRYTVTADQPLTTSILRAKGLIRA